MAHRLQERREVVERRVLFVAVESGFVRVGSLSAPGYGGPFEPDLSSMIPLERWSFASLESMS